MNYKKDATNEFSEIELNIPLDDKILIEEDIDSEIPTGKNIGRTNFSQAWTVKVNTYDNLEELQRDLLDLKALGFKIYSRYETNNPDLYSLFVGPTLEKEDSSAVLKELSDIGKFSPEMQKYD
jgi:cell division septation protein DedD